MRYFPFRALTLLVGRQERHLDCNSWVLVCWWWWFDWSFAHLIAPAVTITSIILAPLKSRMETFWYRLTWIVRETGRYMRAFIIIIVTLHWVCWAAVQQVCLHQPPQATAAERWVRHSLAASSRHSGLQHRSPSDLGHALPGTQAVWISVSNYVSRISETQPDIDVKLKSFISHIYYACEWITSHHLPRESKNQQDTLLFPITLPVSCPLDSEQFWNNKDIQHKRHPLKLIHTSK